MEEEGGQSEVRTSSPACVPKLRPLTPSREIHPSPLSVPLPSPPPLKKKLNQEGSTPSLLSSRRFQRLRARRRKKKRKEGDHRRGWGGGRGEINICVAQARLRFTYLRFPHVSPGAKWRAPQTAKKVSKERIRTEAAPSSGCLTAGDPWGQRFEERGIKEKLKRRERQYVKKKYRGKNIVKDLILSPSISLSLSFFPLSLLGLLVLLASNLLSRPVTVNDTRLE